MSGMMDEVQQSEEAALVLVAQQGDGEAFRTLVELYDRRLLYFIRRILGETEEAFDVLQEVWLRVHRNLRKLRSTRSRSHTAPKPVIQKEWRQNLRRKQRKMESMQSW